jgi:hypothetical protein
VRKRTYECMGLALASALSAVACAPDAPRGRPAASARASLTDGTVDFVTAASYASADLAWGDVDGDGDLDLALAVQGAPDRVFLSGPTGLTEVWQSPLSEDTQAVAFGDVTGDGVLDLVTCGDGAPIRAFAGDGVGGFSAVWNNGQFNRDLRDLALADMDGDGDLDFVVVAYNWQDRVFLNAGSGTSFSSTWSSPGGTWTRAVALGDLDGDGDVDAVLAREWGSAAYLNDGSGSLTSSWGDGWASSTSVALGDWSGDGVLDFVLGARPPWVCISATERGASLREAPSPPARSRG